MTDSAQPAQNDGRVGVTQKAWRARGQMANKITKIIMLNTGSYRTSSYQRRNTCKLHERTSTSIASGIQRAGNAKERNKMLIMKQRATPEKEYRHQWEFKGRTSKITLQNAGPQEGTKTLLRYPNDCQESEKKDLT